MAQMRKCALCGKPFRFPRYRAREATFCTNKCRCTALKLFYQLYRDKVNAQPSSEVRRVA